MTDEELVRLYLRDPAGTDETFSDAEITELLAITGTVEGATALGWLLKAGDAANESVSQSVGNTSESWGQPTETYKICMRMYEYWTQKDITENGGSDWAAGAWMELVPDTMDDRTSARTSTKEAAMGSITARLVEHSKWLEDLYA